MELISLIAACVPAMPPPNLAAIVMHESGGNPFAINLNSQAYKISRVPKTRQEARYVIHALTSNGHGSFDIGLAQINSRHLTRLGLMPEDLLEPCLNLKVAARILGECYARTADLTRTPDPQHRLASALSCYNTGSFSKGFKNGYVQAIYRLARRLGAIDHDQGKYSSTDTVAPRRAVPVHGAMEFSR